MSPARHPARPPSPSPSPCPWPREGPARPARREVLAGALALSAAAALPAVAGAGAAGGAAGGVVAGDGTQAGAVPVAVAPGMAPGSVHLLRRMGRMVLVTAPGRGLAWAAASDGLPPGDRFVTAFLEGDRLALRDRLDGRPLGAVRLAAETRDALRAALPPRGAPVGLPGVLYG